VRLPNKWMKLTERDSLGGSWRDRPSVIESRSAAYPPCSTDLPESATLCKADGEAG
jgi:hypothetical protein